MKILRGRCIEIQSLEANQWQLLVQSETQTERPIVIQPDPPRVGDLVEIENGLARVLTSSRKGGSKWSARILDPRRMRAVKIRAQVESLIREFFLMRRFQETRTPLLVPCPGMEPHIRPFRVERAGPPVFLPTSPEFAMKRLLVGGLERIFQLCPSFRDEPASVTHHPEFTMLEWYRAYAGYEEIMQDTEELLAWIAVRLTGKPELTFQGRSISLAPPWPRLRVRDLFLEHANIDLTRSTDRDSLAKNARTLGISARDSDDWDDLYFNIWLNHVEPRLPADRAVFVTRYPASQAALAVVDTDSDGSRWARRFEAYAGGLELGNAFEELTDPDEQRRRFEKDMKLRARVYGPEFPLTPIDEDFLAALAEGMPPSGGIAMGVDRIVMLFADEPEIDYTLWLPAAPATTA